MRSSLLQRGCVAAVVAVFGAVGWAAVAGATGPGSQVAATAWTTVSAPGIGSDSYDSFVSCVSSVFCVSAADADVDTTTPTVQQWDGRIWTTVTLPAAPAGNDAALEAVSCTSVSFCVAVGVQDNNSIDTPVTYAWNGTAWSLSTTPTLPGPDNDGVLEGVSCTGPTWCVATGYLEDSSTESASALAEEWNGASWTLMSTPSVPNGAESEFGAVSCTGASSCMAVGAYVAQPTGFASFAGPSGFPGTDNPLARARALTDGTSPHIVTTTHVLAEQWNGTSWTVTSTVDPPGVTEPELLAVSCAGSGFCMATGYGDDSDQIQGFAQEWSNGSWSQAALPAAPSGSVYAPLGVSCISPTSCTAVGTTVTGPLGNTTDEVILTASWNGSTWTVVPVPTASGIEAAWVGISCLSGGNCIATGGLFDGDSTGTPLNGQASIGRTGYRLAASDGGVFAYGPAAPSLGAPYLGSMGGSPLNAPVVGAAVMPSGDGYDLVASDGGVFNFGSASFYGSTGSMHLNKPIVGMAMTADGGGYWLVAADGGIFTYGDAQFYGSTGGMHLNSPIVGMAPTPNGLGYCLVASDGGIFAYRQRRLRRLRRRQGLEQADRGHGGDTGRRLLPRRLRRRDLHLRTPSSTAPPVASR